MGLNPNITANKDDAAISVISRLTKFDISKSAFSTTTDLITYNVTVGDIDTDYDGDTGFATTSVKDFISKLSSVPKITTSTPVPNVTEYDSYLSIRNVSSLSCLNQHIPSVYEYLAGNCEIFCCVNGCRLFLRRIAKNICR